MALSDAQWQKLALYVRSYLMRTALNFGHQNGAYRASARWTHSLNVVENVKGILDGEKASEDARDVCMVAAMMHDIDHYTVEAEYHAVRGAETASHFLRKQGYPAEFIKRVAEVINHHDFPLDDDVAIEDQVKNIVETASFEARMVMDADTLDKIGVSNILQSVLTMTATSRRQVSEVARELTSGWPLQRASLWKELLTTPTGKALGKERFAFYERFLKQVASEIVMSDPYPSLTQTQEIAQVSG